MTSGWRKRGDGGKGSSRRNEDVSKVKSNWDLIDWSNKGESKVIDDNDNADDDSIDYSEEEWTCDVCGGPMYSAPHWKHGKCDDCGAIQELINDDY